MGYAIMTFTTKVTTTHQTRLKSSGCSCSFYRATQLC